MDNYSSTRKNPSRVECEGIIKRILSTEVLTKGKNEHFKNASDFLPYFESLYPAGDALTKQVQRAIKNMELPKDNNGYLIINKTNEQIQEEDDLAYFLKHSNAYISDLDDVEPFLIHCDSIDAHYLLSIINKTSSLKDKYETVLETADGILFYTKRKHELMVFFESLLQ